MESRVFGRLSVGRAMLGKHIGQTVEVEAPVGTIRFENPFRRTITQEEYRGLGEVLEVPAVERVAVDIHARAKQAVHLICVHFKPHECKQLRHERAVKRGGKQRSVRQAERLRAAVETHSGRTVVAACAGDTQRGQRI